MDLLSKGETICMDLRHLRSGYESSVINNLLVKNWSPRVVLISNLKILVEKG